MIFNNDKNNTIYWINGIVWSIDFQFIISLRKHLKLIRRSFENRHVKLPINVGVVSI